MSKLFIQNMINETIIGKLNKGILPWKNIWSDNIPINKFLNKPYNTLNQLLLNYSGDYASYGFWADCGNPVVDLSNIEYVIECFPYERYYNGKITVRESVKRYPVFHISKTMNPSFDKHKFKYYNLKNIIKNQSINDIINKAKYDLNICTNSNINKLTDEFVYYGITNICNADSPDIHNYSIDELVNIISNNTSLIFTVCKFSDQIIKYIITGNKSLYQINLKEYNI